MQKEKRGALLALCLGDGYVHSWAATKQPNCTLSITHSHKQLEYIEWKAKRLHTILGGSIPKVHCRNRHDERTNKVYRSCSISRTDKYFNIAHRLLYKDNSKKTYTRKLLNFLTIEGLAIWYMDDGSSKFTVSKKTGKKGSCQTQLATYCSREEARIIVEYFIEVWGIHWAVYTSKRTGQCVLCANTANSIKFLTLIKPHVLPLFYYKIARIL